MSELVPANELMAKRVGSVNPFNHQEEVFELFSIPAYDSGKPETIAGSEIGSSKKNVEPDDVLISRIVPHIRRCWVVPEGSGYRQIASGEWITFRSKRFFPNYLRHYLLSDRFHKQFMQTVSGVGGSLLRARPAEVEKIEIPLPPMKEQKRIAAILDKADAIRRKRQQAIHLADEFLRSVFLDMFGDLFRNSKSWEQIELGRLITDGPQNGLYRPASDYGSGVPILRIDSFYDGYIVPGAEHRRVRITEDLIKKYTLTQHDIVVNRVNSRKFLGKCALIEDLSETTVYESNMMRFSVNINSIDPRFLVDQLTTPYIKQQILTKSRDAVNQSSINQGDVQSLVVHVPPLELQRRYSEIVRMKKAYTVKLDTASDQSRGLFLALSQRAFRGDL